MLARGHVLRALGATWLLRLLLTTASHLCGSCWRRACKSNCVDRGVTSTRRVRLAPHTPAQTDTLLRVVHAHLCCARAAVHSSTEVLQVRLPATPPCSRYVVLVCFAMNEPHTLSHPPSLSPCPALGARAQMLLGSSVQCQVTFLGDGVCV